MIHARNKRSMKLLLAAGAEAAAQGAVRGALFNKLLPIAGAAGFVLRMFRKGRTDSRPVAGNHKTHGPTRGVKRRLNSPRTKLNEGGHSHE